MSRENIGRGNSGGIGRRSRHRTIAGGDRGSRRGGRSGLERCRWTDGSAGRSGGSLSSGFHGPFFPVQQDGDFCPDLRERGPEFRQRLQLGFGFGALDELIQQPVALASFSPSCSTLLWRLASTPKVVHNVYTFISTTTEGFTWKRQG